MRTRMWWIGGRGNVLKRSDKPAKYIGFYQDKAVRAIGMLEKVVRVDRGKKGLRVIEGGPLTAQQEARIEKAMDAAPNHGWNIERGCYFFLAGHVEPTLFRNETKYPLWNRRERAYVQGEIGTRA